MMEIETSVAHDLGGQAALDRLHDMVDSLEARYPEQVHGVKSRWSGNELDVSFAAYGYHINWHATVLADRIALLGRIPASARAFRSKIEQAIVARVEAVVKEQPSHNVRAA